MRKPRTYKQLRNDPRVSDWSDERSMGASNEGLWIYLAPGWVTDQGLSTIHEDTVQFCCDCLSWARYSPEELVAAQDYRCGQPPAQLPAG
jgi:hypothetical protein